MNGNPISEVIRRFHLFWQECPLAMRLFFGLYVAVNGLIVFWVPGNDYDSMTSYVTRFKLAELGPIKETATIEHQIVFPTWYDSLHLPLLKWGYLQALPAFALFLLTCLGLIAYLRPRPALLAVLLLFAAPPILCASTSMKNDLAVGAIGLLAAIALVRFKNPHFYLPVQATLLCMLLGTKWTGVLLIAPLAVLALVWSVRERRCSRWTPWILVGCVPLFFYLSSADVYVANYHDYHTVFPTFPTLSSPARRSSLLENGCALVCTSAVNQFVPVIYKIDEIHNGALWDWLCGHTYYRMPYGWPIGPVSTYSYFGLPLLVVIGGSLLTLGKRNVAAASRVMAGVALFYLGALLYTFEYSGNIDRYLIPTFLLGLIPTVERLAELPWPRVFVWGLTGLAVLTCCHVLLLDEERNFVKFDCWRPDLKLHVCRQRVTKYWFDRDLIYCQSWVGFRDAYHAFRDRVRVSDRLLIVNGGIGEDVPCLYPFLKNRRPDNTRIINRRFYKEGTDAVVAAGLEQGGFVLAYHMQFTAEVSRQLEPINEFPEGSGLKLFRVRQRSEYAPR